MDEPADGAAPVRVAVVGTGKVGATYAYALLLSGLAAEIVLVNRDREHAEGEAMDLTHAVPFAYPTRVWAGDYDDCGGAAITVLTAGAPQGGADSRLDLVRQNGAIFGEIVPEVMRHNPSGILLVASNPVDVLTYAAWKLSSLPRSRVIGSGTILDTARLRALLGQHFGVDPHAVDASVVGEHGDSQVPVWSLASILGMRLPVFGVANDLPHDQATLDEIGRQTRDAGPAVAERKGATYYAVAAGLLRITEAILRDEHAILSVSSVVDGYHGVDDVALSVPSVVGRGGVERTLSLELNEEEASRFRRSADVLRQAAGQLDLP
jgi:L-lactate dehydrogenase